MHRLINKKEKDMNVVMLMTCLKILQIRCHLQTGMEESSQIPSSRIKMLYIGLIDHLSPNHLLQLIHMISAGNELATSGAIGRSGDQVEFYQEMLHRVILETVGSWLH